MIFNFGYILPKIEYQVKAQLMASNISETLNFNAKTALIHQNLTLNQKNDFVGTCMTELFKNLYEPHRGSSFVYSLTRDGDVFFEQKQETKESFCIQTIPAEKNTWVDTWYRIMSPDDVVDQVVKQMEVQYKVFHHRIGKKMRT